MQFLGNTVQKLFRKDTYDLSRIEYQTEYKIEDVTYKKLKDKDKNLINVLNAINGAVFSLSWTKREN